MLTIRKSADRGAARFDWLQSRHTFSFGDYHDPRHMGFGPLRVINEDRVVPGAGFPTHGHRDMEILSYVLAGALEHKDSLGTGSVIRPGEVQRMSAGTGIRHSEFNASATDPVHFLQIWIVPERPGLAPGYEQKALPGLTGGGGLCLIGARDGRNGSVTIHQDVDLYAGRLAPGEQARLPLRPGRSAWVHVASGRIDLNGEDLAAGDGAALTGEAAVAVTAAVDSEVLIFDLVV